MTSIATAWSVILAGQEADSQSDQRQACLDYVVNTYQASITAFIRQWGSFTRAEAEDLTHDYLTQFLEKNWIKTLDPNRGSLRGFLRVSVRHFLLNVRRSEQRRPQQEPLLDETVSPAADATAERVFDRLWGRRILDQAFHDFSATEGNPMQALQVQVLRRHVLDIDGADSASYAATAQALHVTVAQVRNALHRGKIRLAECVKRQIRATVQTEAEVEQELHFLGTVFQ